MQTIGICAALAAWLALSTPAAVAAPHGVHPRPPQGCRPVAERTGEVGCWIIGEQRVGALSQSPYWQIDRFPDRASVEAARTDDGLVLESLGEIWLMTIAGQDWTTPAGATHRASIGPLPVDPRHAYAAQYMEAIFKPGMVSRTHVHSGPEAWFTLSGETCLETPQGVILDRPGDTGRIIPGGPPMALMATGDQARRGLVLILHDASQPATTVVQDWTPKGLCEARLRP